jgi:hypothetical protein
MIRLYPYLLHAGSVGTEAGFLLSSGLELLLGQVRSIPSLSSPSKLRLLACLSLHVHVVCRGYSLYAHPTSCRICGMGVDRPLLMQRHHLALGSATCVTPESCAGADAAAPHPRACCNPKDIMQFIKSVLMQRHNPCMRACTHPPQVHWLLALLHLIQGPASPHLRALHAALKAYESQVGG